MKTHLKHFAIFAFLGLASFSCSNDDNPTGNAPVISGFEYGEGSSHSTEPVAYKGSDLHMEAEILAENTISSITVDIHAHDLTPAEDEVEWDFEKTYTDAKYQVINADFHEHIDIPENIPTGKYHVTLTVTDKLGNSTEIEGHIDILPPVALNSFSVDSSVQRGNDFHAEFFINAVHGIHNITVDVHAHGLTPATGEVEWHFDKIFEEGYHGKTEVEFHEHIDVPETAPVGEYHITFTVEDEAGNTAEYETHIDVTP